MVVAQTPNIVVAKSWQATLVGCGIRCEVTGAELHNVFDGVMTLGGGFRLLVRAEDAAEARRLIDAAEIDGGEAEPDPPTDRGD